ncbi:MAG: S8 family serine peptidase [Phycisphaerales bacterium JB040]
MTRHASTILISALLGAAGTPAGAGEPVTAPTPMGLVTLDADTPDRTHAIGTLSFPPSPKAPGAPSELRYELGPDVFVRTDSVEAVAGLLSTVGPRPEGGDASHRVGLPAGVTVERFEPVPGFVIVRSPSVREAARHARTLWASGRFESVELSAIPEKRLRTPTGELLPMQWHLDNAKDPGHDVNARRAWDLGYTGLGVSVGVVENSMQHPDPFDPTERYHPDLEANINLEIATAHSYYESDHATAVAGIIAADGQNAIGGAGIAFNAGIASQVYGDEATTAATLTYRMGRTDIKNCSWGPGDTGDIYYLTELLAGALEQYGTNGRGKRGGLFIWAGGNGGNSGALNADRADYDCWVGSRFVLGIGAITDQDRAAHYTERGSNIFAVAPSSGGDLGITTTDLTGAGGFDAGNYTSTFGGTSAAAPVAAGAVALMLEANPELTRRDAMHIIADTARRCDPTSPSWRQNGAGVWVSDLYGFGAIDAGAMCLAAETHTPVKPERSITSGRLTYNAPLPDNDTAGVTFEIPMKPGLTIESVELVVNATSTFIGDVEIVLTSPAGTESVLTTTRGTPGDGIHDYPFKSYRPWGEDSGGTWSLRVADQAFADLATLNSVVLTLYGTRCPADLNLDSVLDLGDVDTFVTRFLDQDLSSDFNGDGLVDSADIQAFVASFLAGC